MSELFKKLQFKGSERLWVLNAPDEFLPYLAELSGQVQIDRQLQSDQHYDFAIVFIKSRAEVETYAVPVVSRLNDDAVFWFAYPKKSSKNYKTDLDRDDGWQPLGALGYEGVRMVAIDSDWSAFRLRHFSKIKSMTRSAKLAMSSEGKNRSKV